MEKRLKNVLRAGMFALMVLAAAFNAYADEKEENFGPGFDFYAEEPGSGETLYTVRFSGGLPLYVEQNDTSAPIAVLGDGTAVTVTEGPTDIFAKVRVADSGQEGYVKFAYLKRQDAVVKDSAMYTYEQLEQELWALRDRYPDRLAVTVLGTTPDGRNLYDLTLGNTQAEKHVVIQAGIHARENMNPRLVMEQLEQYLDFYKSGSYHGRAYAELFGNVAVHLVPMTNPDGIAISQYGEAGIRSQELLETVRTCFQADRASGKGSANYGYYLRRWKANARGVDLNRNFPGGFGGGERANHPAYALYPGPSAGSEPETQALMNLVEQLQPSAVISYHSMGQLVYWDVPESRYRDRNREFASLMQSTTGYRQMSAGESEGGYLDWILVRDTPAFSVTIETGSADCPMPASQYPGLWTRNYLVWAAAAEYAMGH